MIGHWSAHLSELASGGGLVVAAEVDNGGPWEFDIVAIVQNDAGYHVVSSSGCSCEERAQYDAGPFASAVEALASVAESHRADLARELAP